MSKSPEEVLSALKLYLKVNNINRSRLAEVLHFKTPQSATNLLSSNKYLNSAQAEILRREFLLNPDFLTSGEGELSLPFIEVSDVAPKSPLWESHPRANSNPYILGKCYFIEYVLNRFREVVNIIGDKEAIDVYEDIAQLSHTIKDVNMNDEDFSFQLAAENCIDFHINYNLEKLKKKYDSGYPVGIYTSLPL